MEDSADMEQGDEAELPEGEAPLEPPPPAPHSDADPNYGVYTTDFDEEIKAEDLAEPAELERLRACSGACRRSRTAHGCLIWRKALWMQGDWQGWWRTQRLR